MLLLLKMKKLKLRSKVGGNSGAKSVTSLCMHQQLPEFSMFCKNLALHAWKQYEKRPCKFNFQRGKTFSCKDSMLELRHRINVLFFYDASNYYRLTKYRSGTICSIPPSRYTFLRIPSPLTRKHILFLKKIFHQ